MLGRRSERGAVAGSGGRGKGGKKRERERKECGCFSFLLSLHPFLFLPLSLFKGVHRRSVADTCPVGDVWGEEKNVPRWNKRCVKLRALSFTDLLCSFASVRRSGADREAVLLIVLCA
jgi:hypothetical protein